MTFAIAQVKLPLSIHVRIAYTHTMHWDTAMHSDGWNKAMAAVNLERKALFIDSRAPIPAEEIEAMLADAVRLQREAEALMKQAMLGSSCNRALDDHLLALEGAKSWAVWAAFVARNQNNRRAAPIDKAVPQQSAEDMKTIAQRVLDYAYPSWTAEMQALHPKVLALQAALAQMAQLHAAHTVQTKDEFDELIVLTNAIIIEADNLLAKANTYWRDIVNQDRQKLGLSPLTK